MRDFQNHLKYLFENDEKPLHSIAGATNASDAYLAYKNSLNSIWAPMKDFLMKADQQLEALEQHAGELRSQAKNLTDIPAHVASFAPQVARPVVDRSRIAAAANRFKVGE